MQIIGIHSIEDCLEILTGLQKHNLEFTVDTSDATIMNSIARQVFKGTALTDRQYNLMREKLYKYKDQFESQDIIGFDRAVEKLRMPLREIDRSKYVKIVETADVYKGRVYESYKDKMQWIKVRFPFSKKLISKIQNIAVGKDFYHEKGTHEHFFKLSEKSIKNIVEAFKDKNFEIDQKILDLYAKIIDIETQKDSIVPCIKNLELLNIHPNSKKLISQELGKLNADNLIQFIDRRRRYGIVDYDATPLSGDLAEYIALRNKKEMLFKPNEHRIADVLSAIDNLERYPLLIVLEENKADEQLHAVYNYYRDFLPAESQSVLFRLEGSNHDFNQMVHDYSLNNWVDNNTKIVYINSNKLPKILFTSDWRPITAFSFNSKISRNVDYYISEYCDLVAFYDDSMSPFRKYSNYYGNLQAYN